MRVLHLLYDSRQNPWIGGGGAVRAHEINRRLAARGMEVRTLSGAFPGAARRLHEDGVAYEFLGASRPYWLSRWSYSRAASRALRKRAYDVAVVDFSVYTPVSLPPRSETRAIVAVVHHVTGVSAEERWGRWLGRWLAREERRRLRQFSWISADSLHTLEEVRRRVSPGAVVRLIGNAVDERLFRLERRECPEPYILYLGRIDLFHKGLDVLLQAFETFSAHSPASQLRIAGTGKDVEELRRLVGRSAVAERIHLLGSVSTDEKLSLLAGAQMVVMPSRLEGWGMVAAEAMAVGVPLIASTAGSLPEVTGGAIGARLVPPSDVHSLVQAMLELEREPELRRTLGARARREARRRFSWDAVAEEHHQFLCEVKERAAGGS